MRRLLLVALLLFVQNEKAALGSILQSGGSVGQGSFTKTITKRSPLPGYDQFDDEITLLLGSAMILYSGDTLETDNQPSKLSIIAPQTGTVAEGVGYVPGTTGYIFEGRKEGTVKIATTSGIPKEWTVNVLKECPPQYKGNFTLPVGETAIFCNLNFVYIDRPDIAQIAGQYPSGDVCACASGYNSYKVLGRKPGVARIKKTTTGATLATVTVIKCLPQYTDEDVTVKVGESFQFCHNGSIYVSPSSVARKTGIISGICECSGPLETSYKITAYSVGVATITGAGGPWTITVVPCFPTYTDVDFEVKVGESVQFCHVGPITITDPLKIFQDGIITGPCACPGYTSYKLTAASAGITTITDGVGGPWTVTVVP
jgi:hypothetical protein